MSGEMTTLMTAIISTGAVIGIGLAGLMIGMVAWIRADMRRMEDRLREDIAAHRRETSESIAAHRKETSEGMAAHRRETDEHRKEIREDIAEHRKETSESIAAHRRETGEHRKETSELLQRMAHLEGLLQGLREAIVSRAAA